MENSYSIETPFVQGGDFRVEDSKETQSTNKKNSWLSKAIAIILYIIRWPVAGDITKNKRSTLLGLLIIVQCVLLSYLISSYEVVKVVDKWILFLTALCGQLIGSRLTAVIAVSNTVRRWIKRILLWIWNYLVELTRWLWTAPVRLFVWAAGADYKTLKDLSPWEMIKYTALGMSMFIPVALGAFSMNFLAKTVFNADQNQAMAAGLAWGIVILMLDRVLIVGMKRNAEGKIPLQSAAIRLPLALLIGLIISTPLELKVFEAEIREGLKFEEVQRFNSLDLEEEAKIKQIDLKIDSERSRVELLYKEYLKEVNTSIGGRRAGSGPEARKKESIWLLAKEELENQILPQLVAEKEEIRKDFQDKKAQYSEFQSKGLGSRLEALHRASRRHVSIFLAHILLVLFFLMLELVPVLVKLLMPAGQYDWLIYNQDAEQKKASHELHQLDDEDLAEFSRERSQRVHQHSESLKRKRLLEDIISVQADINRNEDEEVVLALRQILKRKLTELASL